MCDFVSRKKKKKKKRFAKKGEWVSDYILEWGWGWGWTWSTYTREQRAVYDEPDSVAITGTLSFSFFIKNLNIQFKCFGSIYNASHLCSWIGKYSRTRINSKNNNGKDRLRTAKLGSLYPSFFYPSTWL